MAKKATRHSMSEALKDREGVRAFLEAGKASPKINKAPQDEAQPSVKEPERETNRRIAVTLRLPEKIAHALIDASAERRKKRNRNWSQQDIVAEALEQYFHTPQT